MTQGNNMGRGGGGGPKKLGAILDFLGFFYRAFFEKN
jgi:hypothetical protein